MKDILYLFYLWPFFVVSLDNHCLNIVTRLCQRNIKKLNNLNPSFYLQKDFLKVLNHLNQPFVRYLLAIKWIIILLENAIKSSRNWNVYVTCLKNLLNIHTNLTLSSRINEISVPEILFFLTVGMKVSGVTRDEKAPVM